MRILVVEDTLWQRDLVVHSLREGGCVVDTATNSAEGLRLASRVSYDAIVLDLGLDDLPDEPTIGLHLVRQLRQASRCSVPILIWSGFDNWKTRVEGDRAGANAFVSKSSDVQTILSTLKSLLSSNEEGSFS